MPNEYLTIAELEVIRARCSAASPGPWRSFIEGRDHTSGSDFIAVGEGAERKDIELTGATVYDQDFIASSRTDIILLLDEVVKLRKEVGLDLT